MNDDYSASENTTGRLKIDGSMTGWIETYRDADWIAVTLEAGVTYQFALTAALAGAWPNMWDTPRLDVWDPTGSSFYSKYDLGQYGFDPILWLKPIQAGTYYLMVQGSYQIGQYRLSGTLLAADDVADNYAHAKPIALGQQINGNLELARDRDMFKVELKAGVTYTFVANNDPLQADAATPDIIIYRVDGAGLSERVNAYSAAGEATNVTPEMEGSYYVDVFNTDQVKANAPYTLRVEAAADDFGANSDTSGHIAPGATVIGNTEFNSDRDWLKFSAQAGTTYRFILRDADQIANLAIRDVNGKYLGSNSQYFEGQNVLQWTAGSTGDYFAQVQDLARGKSGAWSLSMVAGQADDYSADASTSGLLRENATVTGRLELPRDEDWIKVQLQEGTAYTFTLAAGGKSLESLRLVDASGMPVTAATIRTAEANQLAFQATRAGDYFLAIRDSSVAQAEYTVTSSSSIADTIAGSSGTNATLAPGQVVRSAIDFYGDRDWFKVELAANVSYTFALDGALSDGGTLGSNGTHPAMELLDGSGNQVAFGSSSTNFEDPSMSFRVSTAGTYYVQVYSDSSGGASATYTLKMADDQTPMVDTRPPKLNYVLAPSRYTDQLDQNIQVLFSEYIVLGTGSVVLRTKDGTVVETFNLGGPRTKVELAALWLDPTAPLEYGTEYVLTLPAGAIKDAAGLPLKNDTVAAFRTVDAPQMLHGTAGNDVFRNGSNRDQIDGGEGIDTIIYQGSSSFYKVSINLQGTFVRPMSSSGPVDMLNSIERLHFESDSGSLILAFDVDGNAGKAYRLYKAAFARAPDQTGLGFWVNALDNGISLPEVARNFVDSAEFRSLYGTANSDTNFLTALYKNVLQRAPDADGLAFWSNAMHSGYGRDQVLAHFSESAENQAAVIGSIQDGIYYVPFG
ncbi:DUF4214 domain-containing protein [Pseudoduganella sp. OTU4001]|uniref:DUF4214 domain-containing protein n=1 Tax=Pseudoduganella sp. OTU4001 TaxID=3043854 RepID=UPI00313EC2D4